MGRYTSDTGASAQPRRKLVAIDVSDPAYAVPAWALNGVVYVSGTAPGAGGGNSATVGERGGGGGAGGYCVRVPMRINGATTIAIVIGAPSAGAAGSSSAAAANAGDTTVTVGPCVLTLQGGRGGLSRPNAGEGGHAVVGSLTGLTVGQGLSGPFGTGNSVSQGLSGSPSPLASGASGGAGNASTQGYGAGAMSPFGGGGLGLASAPAANAPGAKATGYGAGGAGSNGAGVAGAGAPSIVWLEFEEAV